MDSEGKKESASLSGSVSTNEDNLVQHHDFSESININELQDKSTEYSKEESLILKREKRRNKIICEILDTEETYHRHLNLVTEFLEEPLRKLKLIPDHVIVTIFSNIKQIININEELKQNLQILPVGKAFLQIGPFLKLYSTYANNHERALATLMEWEQKRPEFSQFRRQQEERQEFAGLKLNALLITPVQRVPRYKLLLEDLLAHTDEKHDDYSSLKEACAQISAVALHINDHIKQQDNFMKMLAIQKSLAGQLAPKILIPGRMFIKDGPLKKVSKNGGRSHERMFFLFSDILLYGKPKLLESGSSHSYSCCCILPLQHCSVSRVFGHSQGQASLFTIQCKDESLLLYSDQKTVESWLKVLTSAISKFVENRQSLRKESSAKMPVRRSGLVRYMKQQEKSDPLKTAKKSQDSPVNKSGKTTPKTPKFLKRALKEGSEGVQSSPSTPSPRKRQLQEALMKARENVRCLTPRKSGRKKHKDAKTGTEEEDEQDSDFVSSPQVNQKLSSSQLEISLDPSHIWKEGEDSTILEHSMSTNDERRGEDVASNGSDYNPLQYRLDYDDRPYHSNTNDSQAVHTDPSNINTQKINLNDRSCDSTTGDGQVIGTDFTNKAGKCSRGLNGRIYHSSAVEDYGQSFTGDCMNAKSQGVLSGEDSYPSPHSLESYSRISLDREKVRCSQLSADVGGTSVFSVDSPCSYRKRETHQTTATSAAGCNINSPAGHGTARSVQDVLRKKSQNSKYRTTRSVSCSSSETDCSEIRSIQDSHMTDSPGMRICHSPSNVSDTSHSSFNTSLGELNEESLKSLTRHYSLLIQSSEHPRYWQKYRAKDRETTSEKWETVGVSGGELGNSEQYMREDSQCQKLEQYLSPIRQVHSNIQSQDKVQSLPFSSSPICLQHSKDNAVYGGAATLGDRNTEYTHSPCAKDMSCKKLNGRGFIEEYSDNSVPSNLTENVVPLKGWTTCYTKLKRLPGLQEESDSDGEATVDLPNENMKENDSESSPIGVDESCKENVLNWSDALQGASQTAKAMYSTTPHPMAGQGCMIQ